MPNYTTYGQDPIPTPSEAVNIPADLMAYATGIDKKLVHTVQSVAERDTRLAALPAGGLVTCKPLNIIWMSRGQGNWQTIWYDSGKVTSGFTWGATFADDLNRCFVRQVGAFAHLAIEAGYTGTNVTSPADGNIADIVITQVPSTLRPYSNGVYGGCLMGSVSGSVQMMNDGTVSLCNFAPGAVLSSGTHVKLSMTYLVAGS